MDGWTERAVRIVARTLNTVIKDGKCHGAPTASMSDRSTNYLQKLNHVLPLLIWFNNYRHNLICIILIKKQFPTFQKSNASQLDIPAD